MKRALSLAGLTAIAQACASAAPTTATGKNEPASEPPPPLDGADAATVEPEPYETDPCARNRFCPGSPPPALMAELRAIAGQTRACYQRALENNPKLEGRLAVGLRVLEDGRACRAELSDDALAGDAEFARCLLDTFARQYPAPREGCVNTVVPLNFKIQHTDAGAP